MIKKSVKLNPDFENVLSGDNIKSALADGADVLVLETAIKKREELAKNIRGRRRKHQSAPLDSIARQKNEDGRTR